MVTAEVAVSVFVYALAALKTQQPTGKCSATQTKGKAFSYVQTPQRPFPNVKRPNYLRKF